MTAWFAFSMPAGVILILGNIIQILQQIVLNKYFKPNEDDNPLITKKAEIKVIREEAEKRNERNKDKRKTVDEAVK